MLMKKRWLLGLGTIVGVLLGQLASADLLVIGSKQSGIDRMTSSQIADIFMGKPTPFSQQFKPYDQPDYSKAYLEFCEKVLHKSPDEMSAYWGAQVFKGLASPPAQLKSIDELFSLIMSYPSVISYVDSDQIPMSYLQNVRVYYGDRVNKTAVNNSVSSMSNLTQKPVIEKKEKLTMPPREEVPGLWGKVLASNNWDAFYQDDGVQHEIKKLSLTGDLQKRVENATPYIGYVYSQVKKMGIPSQFALLPLMESDYSPIAVNKQGAGLWQLEHATAKDMNIPVNDNYDGRKDIAVSTDAALQHLLDEFNRFHNWELAAAAYNCGTGPVEKAVKNHIREGKPANFWAIRSELPKITQVYVPRLIALSYILNHARDYGLTLPNLPINQVIQTIPVKQELNLARISQLSGVPVETVKILNPGLVVGKTSKEMTYQLMLPVSALNKFTDNLNAMNQELIRLRQEVQAKQQNAAMMKARHEEQAALNAKKTEQVRMEKEKEVSLPQEASPALKKAVPNENLKSLLDKIYEN
jgi:hypothetical protein